jgi:site-specific DNA-methyltransferase (adenine-specific)
MLPYYQDTCTTVYHGDCREILSSLSEQYDFLLTDPPYGIAYDTTESKHGHKLDFNPIGGDATAFDARHLEALNVPSIIWGANCFASSLTDNPGWLTWLKTSPTAIAMEGIREGVRLRKADMEIAWTNFIRRPQAYMQQWIGIAFDSEDGQRSNEKHHPTCKPVELMTWCLDLAPRTCSTVLDPYMGGGSTLVAASYLKGWKSIGIEIEERYCEMAAKRLRLITPSNKIPRIEEVRVRIAAAAGEQLRIVG